MVKLIYTALMQVSDRRYFESERGYQGALNTRLTELLRDSNIFPDEAMVEEEYQKRLKHHGIRLRPDIIIHVPARREAQDRTQDNFVVLLLKRKAKRAKAIEDFCKLDKVIHALNYKLAGFINIDSNDTWLDAYSGPYKERIHSFASIRLSHRLVVRHSWVMGSRLGIEVREEVC